MVPGHSQRQSTPSPKPEPVQPMSNEDTMRQVIDPARQIVKANGLQDVFAGFTFEACNDQGEPPYRGRLEMSFSVPRGIEPKNYIKQIAKTMVQQGWIDGPPPGRRAFGTLIHTDQVWAIMGPHPVSHEDGSVQLYGECRNMVNHRDDPEKDFNVTDRVVS